MRLVSKQIGQIYCSYSTVTGVPMGRLQGWSDEDARTFITVPSSSDDKYSRGVLGVIAGSNQYPGAAVMVCEGAMQAGVGMLRYLGPKKARDLALNHRPEIVTQDGQVQAWVIGSGIDSNRIGWRRILAIRRKIAQGLPVVLDAGALSFLPRGVGQVLITPHHRELSILLNSTGVKVSENDITDDPQKWARFAADSLGVTVLLKGNLTYVVSPEREIDLPPSTSWLATAGTGDVLAGIIGALLATNTIAIAQQPEFISGIAATASLIHSRAAELVSNGGPITAMGVAHAIPKVMSDLLHRRI